MPILNIAHKDSLDSLTVNSTDAEIRANAVVREQYGDLLDRYPDYPVVIAPGRNGIVVRWKENLVVGMMIDKRLLDLNRLWAEFYAAKLPVEDMATLYRMIGYSLCGYEEVFADLFEAGAEANA